MNVRWLFASVIMLGLCAVGYAEDPIKSTMRNRQLRKAKAYQAKRVRDIKTDRFIESEARQAEAMRGRNMENQRHAAELQHAQNGINRNAIEAERNRVMAEGNRAIQRAFGIPICMACGAYGHYVCAPLQKSPAVLEYERMLRGMVP